MGLAHVAPADRCDATAVIGPLAQAPSQGFYFRHGEKPLFGCYHPPRGQARAAAVVLCQPLGSEYIRCHRAFRNLAEQLSRAGFGVLRFDYYASGDSAGESSEGDLDQWLEDVAAAIEECGARSGCRSVAAVGLRLGASLASLCAQRAGALDALVLWEPIMAGRAYLAELQGQHDEFQRSLPSGKQESAVPAGWAELVGVGYSPRLLQQLGALDLRATPPQTRRIAVAGATDAGSDFLDRAEHLSFTAPKIWLEDADRALVPKAGLDHIVKWLSEVYM